MSEEYLPPVLPAGVRVFLDLRMERDAYTLFLAAEQGDKWTVYRLVPTETALYAAQEPSAIFLRSAHAAAFLEAMQTAFARAGVRAASQEGEVRRLEAHLADMRLLALPKPEKTP